MWKLEGVVAVLVHRRINTAVGRIERLLVRFRAGKLRQRAKRTAIVLATEKRERVARKQPAIRLPRTFGWLVKVGKHQAVGCGLQLKTVLETPEMVELLAAAPQAMRILRPKCRALAIELPWVVDQPRKPREKKPRKPRRRTYAIAADFNPPLPRGVLAWARREGFGKRPPD
jgi:hypothetical protein